MASADPLDEVVLSASSTEGSVQAWCVASSLRPLCSRGAHGTAQGLGHVHAAGVVQKQRLGARLPVPPRAVALPRRCVAIAWRRGRRVRSRAPAAAAQNSKGALHAWTWGREQPALRCFTAEPLCALAASADGAFAVGGTASGTLLLWQTGSGKLLRTWPAHHKAVSALAFAPDGSWLASGGDDTTLCVGSLAGALRVSCVHVCAALR